MMMLTLSYSLCLYVVIICIVRTLRTSVILINQIRNNQQNLLEESIDSLALLLSELS